MYIVSIGKLICSRATEKDIQLYIALLINTKEKRKLQKLLWLYMDYFHSHIVFPRACFSPEIQ
jgi:hypothetical protein